jgi:hypothetical protein
VIHVSSISRDLLRRRRAAALRDFAVGCDVANLIWTAWFISLRTLPSGFPALFRILNTATAVGLAAANLLLTAPLP